MLEQNIAEFTKTNVLKWHAKGWKGQGLRIAIYDTKPSIKDFMRSYASIPIDEEIIKYLDVPLNIPGNGHNMCLTQVVHEYLPNEAKLFMLDGNNDLDGRHAQWIVDNNIDMVFCSLSCPFEEDTSGRWKILKDSGLPLFTATGNYTQDKPGFPAAFPWTISVMAVYETTGKVTEYSNDGGDISAFTNIAYPINEDGSRYAFFSGTSCAEPSAGCLYGIWYTHQKTLGVKSTGILAHEFILLNPLDLYEPGWDANSGWGLCRLPDEVPDMEVEDMKIDWELTLDSPIVIDNGVEKVLADKPTIIQKPGGGVVMLPLRAIGETLLGCSVSWDKATNKVRVKNK